MYLQLPNFPISSYLWSQALDCRAGLRGNVTFISALVKYADRQYDATNQP